MLLECKNEVLSILCQLKCQYSIFMPNIEGSFISGYKDFHMGLFVDVFTTFFFFSFTFFLRRTFRLKSKQLLLTILQFCIILLSDTTLMSACLLPFHIDDRYGRGFIFRYPKHVVRCGNCSWLGEINFSNTFRIRFSKNKSFIQEKVMLLTNGTKFLNDFHKSH